MKRKKMNKNAKGKLSTSRQFMEAVEYIKESRNFVYATIAIFFIFMFIGYVMADRLGFLDEVLKGLIEKASGLSGFGLFFFILQNNMMSSFLGFVGGILAGILPLMTLISNGVVLGYVMEKSVGIAGIGVIWRLFPHGIFELPAVFISLALGIKMGFFIFTKDKAKELKRRFFSGLNAFLLIVIPLLIIAALIESVLIVLIS